MTFSSSGELVMDYDNTDGDDKFSLAPTGYPTASYRVIPQSTFENERRGTSFHSKYHCDTTDMPSYIKRTATLRSASIKA